MENFDAEVSNSNEEESSNNRNSVKGAPKVEIEIKGFEKDENKRVTCLDCGKNFMSKNSYNYHKRM